MPGSFLKHSRWPAAVPTLLLAACFLFAPQRLLLPYRLALSMALLALAVYFIRRPPGCPECGQKMVPHAESGVFLCPACEVTKKHRWWSMVGGPG